jgi:DNA-binding XRE family transcriptional regulator
MKAEMSSLRKKLSELKVSDEHSRAVLLRYLEIYRADPESAKVRFGRTLYELVHEGGDITDELRKIESQMSILEQLAKPVPPHQASKARGAKIRTLRGECRWTLEELAEKLGISDRQVRRHEKGEGMRSDSLRAYEDVFKDRLNREIEL